MIIKIADNIISPLGSTTAENYTAAIEGRSALRQYSLPDGSLYTASLFDDALRKDGSDYTFFERLCIDSATDAICRAGIDPSQMSVRFFISTTKGNIHLLQGEAKTIAPDIYLGEAGAKITEHFGNPNPPIIVSNACISGLSAQIVAMRSLRAGICDTAVVIGCDIQSAFIISGFQCLHALVPDRCRPFDAERQGLNLGEAAATIIYTRTDEVAAGQWKIVDGAMCNDANHISGPSRTGEGSYRCLRAIGADAVETAFVSVHGTSTLYNDEMESIALERAGLSDVPIFSLKSIYGHTMGAAGVLETILSMQAVEHGIIFATCGFSTLGTSRPVNISNSVRTTNRHTFIKLLSGFGGCNAAMKFTLATETDIHSIKITPSSVMIDDETVRCNETGAALLTELYRSNEVDYPKFFKMDPLARLGFIASELLLQKCHGGNINDNYGVLLFNRSSSLADDRAFAATIADEQNFFPSPALFVYTLPNIVTGEIAIRHHLHSETNFIVLRDKDTAIMSEQIAIAADKAPQIAGWIDCNGTDDFEAHLLLVPLGCDAGRIAKILQK